MITHPKFYFFDVGIYRTLRPNGPLDRPEEIEGSTLETLLFQELRAVNDYFDLGYALSYWRTSNDAEVDFVLYGKKGLKAFEVKRTGKVRSDDLKGLKAFRKDYPQAETFLVYGGKRRMREGEIEIVPIGECLSGLPKRLGAEDGVSNEQ